MGNDGAAAVVAVAPRSPAPERNSSSLEAAAGLDALLAELPEELLVAQVIRHRLSADDKAALRAASTACRRLVNAAATRVSVDASSSEPEAVCRLLPRAFPATRHLTIKHGGAGVRDEAQAACLEQQRLPALLAQLPSLLSLRYEAPADRRQRGLDMAPALLALLAAASGGDGAVVCTAARPASPGDSAKAASSLSALSLAAAPPAGACEQDDDEPGGARQPARASSEGGNGGSSAAPSAAAPGASPRLEELDLRAGDLPDALLELVGRLPSLRRVSLSSTRPINTRPLSALPLVTCLSLTVTPPLCAALNPLAALSRLQELDLAALAPARGWGAALARALPAGRSLRRLRLAFADVCDDDVAALAGALPELEALNLNCSRHLTRASVTSFASLRGLRSLQLEQTGLSLSAPELAALGAGCPLLAELSADFDLRACSEPPSAGWPRLSALTIPQGCSTASLATLLAGVGGLPGGALALCGLGPNSSEVAASLASRAPALASLTLDGCCRVSEPAAAALGGGLSALVSLTLSDVAAPPAALSALLAASAQHARLAHLTCRRLQALDDGVLRSGVAALGRSLAELCVAGCSAVTGPALLDVAAKQLTCLTRLHVESCAGVDGGTCRAWERAAARR